MELIHDFCLKLIFSNHYVPPGTLLSSSSPLQGSVVSIVLRDQAGDAALEAVIDPDAGKMTVKSVLNPVRHTQELELDRIFQLIGVLQTLVSFLYLKASLFARRIYFQHSDFLSLKGTRTRVHFSISIPDTVSHGNCRYYSLLSPSALSQSDPPVDLSITADPGSHFVLYLKYSLDDFLFQTEFNGFR